VAGPSEGVDDVLAAHREAGSPAVVCLVGNDQGYEAWGAELVEALRGAGATHVVLAGRVPDAWGDVAPDTTIAMGVDALAFLRSIREELAS
jgi:methylmalonyl-CoA mutase